jgi:hypothetical protein
VKALLFFFGGLVLAQAPAETPAATPPPAAPSYVYQGKPIALRSSCARETLTAAGLVCSPEEPCTVLLELTAMATAGLRLFLIGNLHTSDATLESLILASDDEGKSWYEPHERIPLTVLHAIEFADLEVGWISGNVFLALPRDPFLLITRDGGKTWRKRPLFDETRIGSIEQFALVDRNRGHLLLDRVQTGGEGLRYELYETESGGENWILRRALAKPVPLRPTLSNESGWRIRSDGRLKALVVERRAGERWQGVASFAIDAGVCTGEEAVSKAEPSPPPEPESPSEPPSPSKPVTPTRPSLRKRR